MATAEDVLTHKLYWSKLTPSERQLLDAAGIFAAQAGDLDLDCLKLWAAKLGVSAELDDLIPGRLRRKVSDVGAAGGAQKMNVIGSVQGDCRCVDEVHPAPMANAQ